MKQKNRFNLINEYKKSWKYIIESKKFIFSIIAIFFVFALIGFLFPIPDFLYNTILEFIREILEETENLSQSELILYIISNNVQSSFLGILFGFIYGIFPLIIAIANGYVLGFVSLMSVKSAGVSSLLEIIPHGIFELPAIFISLGLGLKFGTFVFQKNKAKGFKNYLINSLRVFFLIVIPLLIIAGIIEGTLIFIN
ncbi:stage II sporulation protein M [Candidatus Pacearchaeota archaeon]|jgi:stage II sporulation protein M|nr:stage II sporulation protein M [Candidatus Pacearchaeota archaeon]